LPKERVQCTSCHTSVSIPATKATDVTKLSARLVASSSDAGGGMPCLEYDALLPEPKVVNSPHAIGQVQPTSVTDKFYFDTSTGTIRSQNCGRKAKYDSPSDMCLQCAGLVGDSDLVTIVNRAHDASAHLKPFKFAYLTHRQLAQKCTFQRQQRNVAEVEK
jgi:hypothetical protein